MISNTDFIFHHEFGRDVQLAIRFFRTVPVDEDDSGQIRRETERPYVKHLFLGYASALAHHMPNIEHTYSIKFGYNFMCV